MRAWLFILFYTRAGFHFGRESERACDTCRITLGKSSRNVAPPAIIVYGHEWDISIRAHMIISLHALYRRWQITRSRSYSLILAQ